MNSLADALARRLEADPGNWLILPPIPFNPYETDFRDDAFAPYPPSLEHRHYLGSDVTGRDIAARLVYGFRLAMAFAVILLLCEYLVGVSIGCAMGFWGGSFDLVHVTVADNAGAGVRKGAGHVGALRNGIAFDNAGGELAGFAIGQVFASDAGPGFAGVDGNIDADPLFADAAAGDLGLGAGSPCVDAADLATALGVVKDAREASRVLDDDLDGVAGADMGAYERAAYELVFAETPDESSLDVLARERVAHEHALMHGAFALDLLVRALALAEQAADVGEHAR